MLWIIIQLNKVPSKDPALTLVCNIAQIANRKAAGGGQSDIEAQKSIGREGERVAAEKEGCESAANISTTAKLTLSFRLKNKVFITTLCRLGTFVKVPDLS